MRGYFWKFCCLSLLLMGLMPNPAMAKGLYFEDSDVTFSRDRPGASDSKIRDIFDSIFRRDRENEASIQFSPGSPFVRQASSSRPSIFIAVSRDGENWQNFSVISGRSRKVDCNYYQKIKVSTEGHNTPAEYDLMCQTRHVIYWNQQLERWDIATID